MNYIAFLPVVVFLCFRIYTCFVYEHCSAICKILPTESIVYSIVFLLISFRLFIQCLIIAGSTRYLQKFNDAIESPYSWTYAALLYLMPTVEFVIELIIFPGLKNATTWFSFVSAFLRELAQVFEINEEKLFQFTIAFYIIALYILALLLYIFVLFQQRHCYQFCWSVIESVLKLFLLVIEQVRK